MDFPFFQIDRTERPDKPLDLPLTQHGGNELDPDYVTDQDLADAVNVALLLGRPLLLTGEPGAGKTQLAYHIAWQLGLEKPIKFETKSNSSARDLFYIYNHLGHFHAAQAKQDKPPREYLTYNALGLAIMLANPRKAVAEILPSHFDTDLQRQFGKDFHYTGQPMRSVVLVDELDKAPRDFPNDILNEMEAMYFRIPELDNCSVEADLTMRPVMVLTSNSEKHLPEAFLRRCVYYHIPFPPQERLAQIVEKRLGSEASGEFLNDALDLFLILRAAKNVLSKKPATAELLNWLTALRQMYQGETNPLATHADAALRTFGSLVKTKEDREKAERIIKDWKVKREA
ncbi:MAG: AAA family ATPase [Gammaproteobacteria bacterium]|nr:AAA family ATPase [Gammaproteobacteria bacterium]